MKRPTSHISGNSIKPALSKAVEFYTDNNRQAYDCIHERDEYIDYLESKLSNARPQQALPVVPEDVDKAIKYLKTQNNFATLSDFDDILTEKGFWWLNDFQFKDRRFGFGGLNNKLFILSHLAVTGYEVEKPQVEKPQMFYLREKNTGHYLRKTGNNEYKITPHYSNDYDEKYMHYKFTQQEIDSMETGSYEQIEVEK